MSEVTGCVVNAQVTGATDYSGRVARSVTGDPVNTKTNEGMTALHAAVRSQNVNLVRYLLDHGARTNIKDVSGRTPLDVLNGVTALQPAAYADASGTISREAALAALAAILLAHAPEVLQHFSWHPLGHALMVHLTRLR